MYAGWCFEIKFDVHCFNLCLKVSIRKWQQLKYYALVVVLTRSARTSSQRKRSNDNNSYSNNNDLPLTRATWRDKYPSLSLNCSRLNSLECAIILTDRKWRLFEDTGSKTSASRKTGARISYANFTSHKINADECFFSPLIVHFELKHPVFNRSNYLPKIRVQSKLFADSGVDAGIAAGCGVELKAKESVRK